jgi:hypothetical protein
MRCHACGNWGSLDAKYCSQYGQPIFVQDSSAPTTRPANLRPLTVMSCDLADSTAMDAQLDPEAWQDILIQPAS